MMPPSRRQWFVTFCLPAVLALVPGPAAAQQSSKSAPLVKELTGMLDQAKLTTVAAKVSEKGDEYVAAMYFPGGQLLLVSARYSVPMYVDEKLEKKEYMEVYIDLNSASVPESKVFISDLQCNGLVAMPEDGQPFDTYEAGGKSTIFDKNWKRQNMTEDDYQKRFAAADDQYSTLLNVLIAGLKKT